jgi:FixJ family two-component response regulator
MTTTLDAAACADTKVRSTGQREAHDLVRRCCLIADVVHVRPTVFFDGFFLTLTSDSVRQSNRIRLPFGEGKTSPVSADDAPERAAIRQEPCGGIHERRADGRERVAFRCSSAAGRPMALAPEVRSTIAAMPAPDHIVIIVDDDPSIREALLGLLSSFDMNAIAFGSAADYLAYTKPDVPACLVLDVELPDMNGLELQRQISEGDHPHIVFITGHGDIPSSVRAIRTGAVDFLTKPFRQETLMQAIHAALAQNRESRRKRAELAVLQSRFEQLTPRERDVLPLVVSGLLNKQAAMQLGISEVTLQIHRGNVMKKMHAASLADLVRMAGALEIPITLPAK